ncbi:WAT1-related protein At4g30420-like isoform X2 [Silene latifolia]|uniref:WAT1-related protein At4g30420-like isoform X2 n=1 Tax=Silene latifolia TaxID=37657 RepID=UPI003D76A913
MGVGDDHLPAVAMVCLQLVSAGTALLNRTAFLNGVDPMVFIVYRQAIAASVTFPISYFTRKQPSRCPSSMGIKSFVLIFTTAFLGITLSQYLYNKGLYMTSSSIATASSNLAPAITFIFALTFGLEQVKIRRLSSMAKIVGTSISVGGAICIALLRGPRIFNTQLLPPSTNTFSMLHLLASDQTWLLGCLCLFASMLVWSSWLILQVPITKYYPDPLSLSAWLSLLAMFQAAAIAWFTVKDPKAWIISSPLELTSLYFSGVVGSGITVFVQAWCITRRGPFFTSVFAPLATVVTTLLECIISHESLYLGRIIHCTMGKSSRGEDQ